jgi:hypothetical protein
MPLTNDYNGNIITSSNPSALWSNKGGMFISSNGTSTYFPIPMFYRTSVNVAGSFVVTPEYQFRADLLAKKLYNDEDYWWLIFWMSGIIDPVSGPKVNDIILIADLNSLNSLFS